MELVAFLIIIFLLGWKFKCQCLLKRGVLRSQGFPQWPSTNHILEHPNPSYILFQHSREFPHVLEDWRSAIWLSFFILQNTLAGGMYECPTKNALNTALLKCHSFNIVGGIFEEAGKTIPSTMQLMILPAQPLHTSLIGVTPSTSILHSLWCMTDAHCFDTFYYSLSSHT